jgi:hypothetical protein
MRSTMGRVFTFGLVLILPSVFTGTTDLVFGDNEIVPVHDPGTFSTFLWLDPQICLYFLKNHRLPQKLSDLPPYVFPPDDGWGKQFDYSPQQDGSVVLSSHGNKGEADSLVFRFSMVDMGNKDTMRASLITFIHMNTLDQSIRHYLADNNCLPTRLTDEDIPLFIRDGWNDLISYSVQPDGSVLLVSHGKPGSGQIFSLQFTVPATVRPGPTTASTEPDNAAPTSRAAPSAP